jgi:PAS domain S-box-containing protein
VNKTPLSHRSPSERGQTPPIGIRPDDHDGAVISSGRTRETQPAKDAVRVLLIEDSDDDAQLIIRALRAAGFQPITRIVETEAAFASALLTAGWDAIISDHSLPRFGSTAALAYMQRRGLDLPFIVVSGTITEESAVPVLRAGAHDFVTKQSLARLGPALRRELHEANVRADRRVAQNELKLQRDFFRLVLDTTPNVIFVHDDKGRFTLANRAALELFNAPIDAPGRTPDPPSAATGDANRFLVAGREVIADHTPRTVAAEQITDSATGAARWFDMEYVPLTMADGTRQVLGVGTEVTEQRKTQDALRSAEEQFRQAQKMEAVGQLAGGIAHDFNNLLTAILGYSELLSDQIGDQPEVAADVEEIRKAGQRARDLTAQLLAFSRKQVLERRVVDVNRLVNDAHRILRRLIGDNIRLEIALDPNLPRIKADPGQMHQVILNLAINARDAMPQGGTLRLTTGTGFGPAADAGSPSNAQRLVTLTIADTGCGMPPDVRSRIFEPFFTTKAPGKGTGLGLAMVFGVVTQSGGTIDVTSQAGEGTTFTICLPGIDVEASDTPGLVARQRPHGTETILLVEDETAIRELVRRVLGGYGYRVLEAADPEHAARIAEEHSNAIHLLVSDIVMPGLSGPDLAQRIACRRPQMRVLYMSGFAGGLNTASGTLSSGVTVLPKPFTPEQLAQQVRACLDR